MAKGFVGRNPYELSRRETWKVQEEKKFSEEVFFNTHREALDHLAFLRKSRGENAVVSPVIKEGYWVYTENHVQVFMPNVHVQRSSKTLHAIPLLEGSKLAVYSEPMKGFVGWVEVEDLGFETVDEFRGSSMYVAGYDYV